MSLFKRDRALEIAAVSGTVRVTVTPKPAWISLLLEGVGIVYFYVYIFRSWASMPLWFRALLTWVGVSAVIAWFYQLSGSEIIEFDAQKLVISKQILGWDRRREYAIADCRDLEWREGKGESHCYGLQCKVGWRSVRFGAYISEGEATEVLTALQTILPDVAREMLATKKYFTTLDLS